MIYKCCCSSASQVQNSPVLSLEKSLNSDYNYPSLTEELLNQRKEGQFYQSDETEESENDSESGDFRDQIGENLTSSCTNSQSNDEISSIKSNIEKINFKTQESEDEDFHSMKARNLTPRNTRKKMKKKLSKIFKKTKTQVS